jgi:hypothetical protein
MWQSVARSNPPHQEERRARLSSSEPGKPEKRYYPKSVQIPVAQNLAIIDSAPESSTGENQHKRQSIPCRCDDLPGNYRVFRTRDPTWYLHRSHHLAARIRDPYLYPLCSSRVHSLLRKHTECLWSGVRRKIDIRQELRVISKRDRTEHSASKYVDGWMARTRQPNVREQNVVSDCNRNTQMLFQQRKEPKVVQLFCNY